MDNLVICLPIERRVASQENVEDYSTTPQVTLLVIVLLEHLRGDVVWRAELLAHLLARVEDTRGAKVNDGHFGRTSVFVEEKILWLQVSVHDVSAVAVVDGA